MKAKTKNSVLTIKSVSQYGEDLTTTFFVTYNHSGENYVLIRRTYLAEKINGRAVKVSGIRNGKFECIEEFALYISSFKEVIKWATEISTF